MPLTRAGMRCRFSLVAPGGVRPQPMPMAKMCMAGVFTATPLLMGGEDDQRHGLA